MSGRSPSVPSPKIYRAPLASSTLSEEFEEMSRAIVAAAAVLILAALLFWQHVRERAIAQCESKGGAWNGPRSVCVPHPGPIIIQRDLHRS
ncbi:MAG: hypothetical protein ACREC6_14485 [Hyphomicrobiaceae bacterium]